MSCRKIPLVERTPTATRAGRAGRGVLSFGYFSLHKQRKVTRSAGVKALDFAFAFKAVDFCLSVFPSPPTHHLHHTAITHSRLARRHHRITKLHPGTHLNPAILIRPECQCRALRPPFAHHIHRRFIVFIQ